MLSYKETIEFLDIMKKYIDDCIEEKLSAFIQKKVATVITVDNTAKTATVRLPQSLSDGSKDLVGLSNKSGINLSPNDQVYLHYFNNNLSNSYIAVKK